MTPRRPRIALSRRFTLVFSLGILLTAGVLALAAEFYLGRVLSRQSELRARSLALGLAAVARPHLLHYDYITLQQVADGFLREPDLAYVVVLDKEGKVAGYGGHRELLGHRLSGLSNQRALAAQSAVVQRVEWTEEKGRTIAVAEGVVPVRIEETPSRRWGTVRVGLSLEGVQRELWTTRLFLILIGLGGVLGAVLASHVLARRIVRPLSSLVEATGRLESGTWDPNFSLETGDEIEELARSFTSAAQSLDKKTRQLVAAKEELTALNASLEVEVHRRTAELSASQEKYQLLVEGNPDGFVLLEGGRFVFVNQGFANIFEYPQAKVMEESFRWTQVIHHNYHRLAREHFRRAEEEMSVFRVDLLGLRRGGRPIELEVRGRGVRFRGKPALELVLADVTEKRRLLRQVVQSERLRAMGEMTAMVAHHFNNLLAIMLGRCQLLQMKVRDEGVKNGLEVIQSSVLKAGEMVRHLQDYYGEQVDLRFGEVDMNTLLRDLALYQDNLWRTTRPPEAPPIAIRLDLSPVPTVRGAEPLLEDAFRRILINAAEAMPEGGEIKIHSEVQNGFVLVWIEDPGVGMPPEILSRAFDPFFTTKGPATRGLGLPASLGIFQRHEGRMRLESQPGIGTKVEIRLPVQSRIAQIVPLARLDGDVQPATSSVEQKQAAGAEHARQADHPGQARQAQA